MRECWINVYYNPYFGYWYGMHFTVKELADRFLDKTCSAGYRIHVRMK